MPFRVGSAPPRGRLGTVNQPWHTGTSQESRTTGKVGAGSLYLWERAGGEGWPSAGNLAADAHPSPARSSRPLPEGEANSSTAPRIARQRVVVVGDLAPRVGVRVG